MAEADPGKAEVTIVANDIGPMGGMERQLSELIAGLLSEGHRITVISWTCAVPTHPNLRWIRVPGPSRPFVVAYPLFLLWGSLLVWRHGRGVVHSTGAIVLNRTAVRTVHFCHRAAAQLAEFNRFSRAGLAYRLNGRLAGTMSRLAERFCYRPGRARLLVGVSEGVVEELRLHFPKMRDRILSIPNGVDTDAFRPGDPVQTCDSDRLDVLFVGSEWRGKGLGLAIEALKGSPDTTLTVVGRGDAHAFGRLADRLGVAERVRFVGATADVAPWYRGADVFLLPTAYETFSLVAFEAAASGLPMLVTRVNGVEGLIRDGENGWFIEPDAEDISRRLCRLRADPQLRIAMGRAARSDSLEYSWARMVGRYRELYADSITSARNSVT